MAATLDLKLMPPPPVTAQTALVVIGATAIVLLLAGLRFWWLGAWPVIAFMALDIVLLVWAFRASARASRAYERLRTEGGMLVVEKVAADGAHREYRLEARATRVELEDLGAPENRLWLRYRNRRLGIGRFLSPMERREVHGVLSRALAG
jgi:uncharacterized membrane protein